MEPVKLNSTIYQGATFRLDLDRVMYPYPVTVNADGQVLRVDGTPAAEEDRSADSYLNCMARMQIRQTIDSSVVIATLTTENDGIVLASNRVSLYISDEDTADMTGWQTAIGHIEIVRQNGDVERQYEITFTLDPEVTK